MLRPVTGRPLGQGVMKPNAIAVLVVVAVASCSKLNVHDSQANDPASSAAGSGSSGSGPGDGPSNAPPISQGSGSGPPGPQGNGSDAPVQSDAPVFAGPGPSYPAAGSTPDARGIDDAGGLGGNVGAPVDAFTPDAEPDCPTGTHRCATGCVDNKSPSSCGPIACDSCPDIKGGTASCDGTKCGASCPADQQACMGECILKTAMCVTSCLAGAECNPGETRTMPCGNCGQRKDTCSKSCTWTMATCGREGECVPGASKQSTCGNCGTSIDTCSSSCKFVAGACNNQGVCKPGSVKAVPGVCPLCGTRTDVCGPNCVFNAGACSTPKDACQPGTTKPEPCAKCGTITKTCNSQCKFDSTKCEGQGQCDPGQLAPISCGVGGAGKQARNCDSSCQIQNVGSCMPPPCNPRACDGMNAPVCQKIKANCDVATGTTACSFEPDPSNNNGCDSKQCDGSVCAPVPPPPMPPPCAGSGESCVSAPCCPGAGFCRAGSPPSPFNKFCVAPLPATPGTPSN
jgi:hypothetical protein